ncbi:MAG: 2,3-bisphosphoglycerate-independent phosphoglycerate mutase [Phycisphaerae bacterium]
MSPCLLIIRDGWGYNPNPELDAYNAVTQANTPVADRLMATYPHTLVRTSGFDVGLPEDTMGNSEVGHQNIGAGRIVDQESVRITKAIRGGSFFDNPVLKAAVQSSLDRGGALHLFGIVSDAGVHGLLEHLYACLELARRMNQTKVFLHAFTDGRDTPPRSGLGYIKAVEAKMRQIGVGKIATVSGRYWAMDRDNRWQRVARAYNAIAAGDGPTFASATQAVQSYYDHPDQPTMQGDEFVSPAVITENGKPIGTVSDGDSVIFYNYRGDRPRELTRAFTDPAFDGFERPKKLDAHFCTMTRYEEGLPVQVAYAKPPKMKNILGEYLAAKGLKQFRSAETEKFPHVTFFFNDYRDQPFDGEERDNPPSPKVLPNGEPLNTYDQLPEMSAPKVTEAALKAIRSGKFAFLLVNYANGDMVGHTGSLEAAVRACEIVDAGVGQLVDAMLEAGGTCVVTADHGNAEQMFDPTSGSPHTAHTTFTVPLIVVAEQAKGKTLRDEGRLADIAPTCLKLMGLEKPEDMTGQSLL